MADRYPLVYNPSANQLQELQSGDSLDVGNSSVKGATGYATTTGTSAQFLKADGSVDSNTYLTSVGTVALAQGLTGSPNITISNLTGANGTFSGDITAVNGTFTGDVSIAGTITYDDVTHVDSQGIGTFRQGINVVGHTELDRLRVSGVSTFAGAIDASSADFSGRIVGAGVSNVVPFLYATLNDLPSATTYHGAFAHVHATGKAYYAHAGAWVELVSNNVETSGNVLVGSGITMYAATGIVSATAFYGDGSKLTGVAAAGSGGGALDITSCLFI